jgi:hypothetical protein
MKEVEDDIVEDESESEGKEGDVSTCFPKETRREVSATHSEDDLRQGDARRERVGV